MSDFAEKSKTFALIMAGGKGTRFWPESTERKPKQYLNLLGDKSLLKQTIDRLDGFASPENVFVVTVKDQEGLIKKNMEGKVPAQNIVFEPSGRNTAPCILLSLAELLEKGASKDDVVAIMPSDHVILNELGFRATLEKAAHQAIKHDSIVVIGIQPHFPHTGYGYIERGEKKEEHCSIYKVQSFKEKPSKEKALDYLKSGQYFWNAGLFISKIGILLEEFKTHASNTYSYFSEIQKLLKKQESIGETYSKLQSESIDYAVMEKSQRVMVIPAEFDWSDLGSWEALEEVLSPEDGNTLVKVEGHYVKEAEGNIIFAPGKFVSLIGVKDLVVVSNEKVLMVMPKSDSQKVKEIVDALKEHDRPYQELL